jgi:hypothetical protein
MVSRRFDKISNPEPHIRCFLDLRLLCAAQPSAFLPLTRCTMMLLLSLVDMGGYSTHPATKGTAQGDEGIQLAMR